MGEAIQLLVASVLFIGWLIALMRWANGTPEAGTEHRSEHVLQDAQHLSGGMAFGAGATGWGGDSCDSSGDAGGGGGGD